MAWKVRRWAVAVVVVVVVEVVVRGRDGAGRKAADGLCWWARWCTHMEGEVERAVLVDVVVKGRRAAVVCFGREARHTCAAGASGRADSDDALERRLVFIGMGTPWGTPWRNW